MNACRLSALYCCAALLLPGCRPESGPGIPEQGTERVALELTPFGDLNSGPQEVLSHAGEWQDSRLTLEYRASGFLGKEILTTPYAHYPRMTRMSDGSWIVTCHDENNVTVNGRNVYYATSPDLKRWTRRGLLFSERAITTSRGVKTARIYTNGQLLQLRNGDLLAIASYRLNDGYGLVDSQVDHGIELRRSSDCARTWSDAQEIYHGTNWEGMLLELDSGEIQCYFSESRPWISGGHSGTGMIRSFDGGKTWAPDRVGNPYTVVREAYTHHESGKILYTDQMPAVIKLYGSEGYAGAFEARRSNSSAYGISLAWSMDGLWPELVDSDGSYPVVMNQKCGPSDRHSYAWTGTAPTLMQFPSGETVVGYSAGYKGANHLMYRMGDVEARNFGTAAPALPHQGSWGAVSPIGTHEMAAVNRDSEDSDNVGVSYAVYALNHGIKAADHPVTLDGRNRDWPPTDQALFVGSKQDAQATLRCSCDGKNMYFLIEILDENVSAADSTTLVLAPSGTTFMHRNCIRIMASCMGVGKASSFMDDAWRENTSIGSAGLSAFDATPDDYSDLDAGWLCEIAIPLDKIPFFEDRVLVNLSLTKADTGLADSIAPADNAATWLTISK